MSLSNLYFRGCFEQPSAQQKSAVEVTGADGDVVDRSCARASVNTCGMSIDDLFHTYSVYDPQKGLYRSWGDIVFPWEISSLTPNLLVSGTDDKWSIATYRSVIAYFQGARVLLIEEDGYRVSLYQANENIAATTKFFDRSKWTEVCHIDTTEPAGLPSISELRSRYEQYSLDLFEKRWEKYETDWLSNLSQQSLSQCVSSNSTTELLEKCLKSSPSDKWGEARARRQFFYRAGDTVLVDGECGDVVCVYTATQDIPATEQILSSQSTFNPQNPMWQRMYCVPTGRNKCLEYQRRKEPELGYDVVEIGSRGHFVEMPVPFRLRPNSASLDELAELRTPPKVLSQEEIDALPQPNQE